jgi:hypothetical protein
MSSVMAESRRCSVESKEFEVLIKEGASGVRIFERSKRKQRSIFLNNGEVAWLAGTVKEVVVWKCLRCFGINQELGIQGSSFRNALMCMDIF